VNNTRLKSNHLPACGCGPIMHFAFAANNMPAPRPGRPTAAADQGEVGIKWAPGTGLPDFPYASQRGGRVAVTQ
jgi:hypothetical protein